MTAQAVFGSEAGPLDLHGGVNSEDSRFTQFGSYS